MSKKHLHASGPGLQQTSTLKHKLLMYEKGLIKLTEATDLSMIDSSRNAVTDLTRQQKAACLVSSTADSLPTLLIRRLLYLAIPATANCTRITVQQCQTPVFSMIHTTELSAADTPSKDILLTLYHDIKLMLMRLSKEVTQQPVLSRIKAAGLIPAFVDYSQAAIEALVKLAAADNSCTEQQQPDASNEQQQQQQQLSDEIGSAVAVLHEVYELWTCLFASAIGSKVDAELIAAAPTVVQLAVSSVPLLQTAFRRSSERSSCSTSQKATLAASFLRELCLLRYRAQELAVFITTVMDWAQELDNGGNAIQQQQQHQRQRRKHPKKEDQRSQLHLSPDHAIRLLLLTLTRQAEILSHCSHTSSLSRLGTNQQQQQQQQQQQPAKHHTVFNSHTALLADLGFPTAPAALTGHHKLNMFSFEPMPVEVVCYSSIFFLCDLIAHLSGPDSSSSSGRHCTKSADVKHDHDDHQQQQQQHEQTCQSQLVHHLLLPTVKLLIEIMLLLPEDDVDCRAYSLEAILLLLQAAQAAESLPALSAAAQSTTAAAAGSSIAPWAPLLANIAFEKRSVTQAEVGPWNLTLSITTAAGLLVPVIQLMSRVVIHSLKMTETQQQQQQQQNVAGGGSAANRRTKVVHQQHGVGGPRRQRLPSGSVHTAVGCITTSSSTMPVDTKAATRALLLRQFGNLLITVCTSVQPQHIASALKHDPVMPLIAVEAVIRTQACRLMGAGWSQRQWQQQEWQERKLQQQQRQYWKQHRGHRRSQQAAATQACEASSSASTQMAASSLEHAGCPLADGAATELLLFVSRVLEALHMLLLRDPLPEATHMTSKEVPELLLRIFTIIITACKTYQAVTTAAAEVDIRQQPDNQQGLQSLLQHKEDLQAAVVLADVCNLLVLSLKRSIERISSHYLSSGDPCDIQCQHHLAQFVTVRVMSHDPAKTSMLQQTQQEISSLTTKMAVTSAADIAVCLQQLATTDMQVTKQFQTADLEQQDDDELQEQYAEQKRILADQGFSCPVLSWCCNNPSCSNLSKLSEYQLVSGKACVCGGCEVARYCSKGCQQQHWKQHKGSCHKLAKEPVSSRAA